MLTYHHRCETCGGPLNDPQNMRETLDCGGDCVKCMADAGDQHAIDVLTTLHGVTPEAIAVLKDTWEQMTAVFNPEHPDRDENGWVVPPLPEWLGLLERTAWPNAWKRSKRKS